MGRGFADPYASEHQAEDTVFMGRAAHRGCGRACEAPPPSPLVHVPFDEVVRVSPAPVISYGGGVKKNRVQGILSWAPSRRPPQASEDAEA